MAISLDDKYTAERGAVYLTGTQALVRLPMTQIRRDRAAGLNTAGFISGYRGSPLGAYDQQLVKARKHLDRHEVVFQPGLNEDLAATAVWGSQQLHLSPGARKDGIVGIWYGKGPGVDRSGDVFKHANAAGSSRHGGVLAIAGDDHTCKSSSIPHQSDHAFISALMPMLYPSSVHEFLEMGLLGIAMSRYSGCWVGFKVISETVEITSVVDLAQEARQFVLPTDFELPPDGLNLRWPDPPLVQDERLQEHKGYAAIAFARANGVDRLVIDHPNARFGIVASGKAYEDVRQALAELGLGPQEQAAIGMRLYKVRMPWPLEPEGIRAFSRGLEEVLIVEERREIIENQIKEQLFNWRPDVRPRIVGKFDEAGHPFLHLSAGLTVGSVAGAIAERLLRLDLPEGMAAHLRARTEVLHRAEARGAEHAPPVLRLPHYCAGCPHNTSTRVPEGSKAMAGIGCHFMAQWMDRRTETFTHMGAEGVPWTAISRFTDEKHRFVNLGDGTYFHSGHLAIRQSVAAGANITYKILVNDAVAMTGGQPIDGVLTPQQITHQMYHERVARIVLMSDHPEVYRPADLAPGTAIRHRDEIDAVMLELREVPGVTIIVFEQTCAAEKRRRRKRGALEDPPLRLWINPQVCEGCGDCSEKSNCIAVEPLETELGRKRRINQSACNKDYSCLKGFCPSFVTVRGGGLRKNQPQGGADVTALPEPDLPEIDRAWNLALAGVGGTGVLTISAILGMAAHVEGKIPMVLDMAGLAQKGGAVMSHVRISRPDRPIAAPRIAAGSADLLLAADSVVAASKDAILLCSPDRTEAVLNTRITPVSDFVRLRDFDFREPQVEASVTAAVRSARHFRNFSALAQRLTGDEIGANLMMLGYAWQNGLVPLASASILEAIALNGTAVRANTDAFNWGRLLAHDPARVELLAHVPKPPEPLSLDALIARRAAHLTDYQNAALAERYRAGLAGVVAAAARIGAADLPRIAAEAYAKVLAYKDEYEVARLYSLPAFRAGLEAEFSGDYRIALNLAPPILPGKAADGRPRKREFGPWILPVLRLLARLKPLRGTWADPFGQSHDRKLERALIALYEADLALAAQTLTAETLPTLRELLSLPRDIRGYGPVKDAAFKRQMARRDRLRAALQDKTSAAVAAE
ncbi:indolepyruvate ferredoxin oxidoreductase family protein [Tabrizicola oligotrophica]|uniref:Indolepyruvate ferredoxin oxidoreductase family protein n=1 Tax=Tabrizicola oligotrophica TaxID=2710650 RepID=A0A6M0QRQ5_9RHOB|nr:indolepyruvate ferredoxin oxidoreductase family protein [Tabrizicola oligotrophica]NEY90086.1 indolepyruvate ferredoxin oxidoreductase family protein [Tabrizicola oligotrophica]